MRRACAAANLEAYAHARSLKNGGETATPPPSSVEPFQEKRASRRRSMAGGERRNTRKRDETGHRIFYARRFLCKLETSTGIMFPKPFSHRQENKVSEHAITELELKCKLRQKVCVAAFV